MYFCLIEANRKLREQNPKHGFDHAPTAEGRNPPDADDAPDAKRKRKIPDFYWGYIDHLEPDPRRSARNFYIECKRLGAPVRKDQIFTSLYIQKGIRQFITEEHGYAMGERSAAMVGYTQNMELEDILREVGVTASANSEPIPPLQLSSDGWQEESITELRHNLERPFPISPMQLYHFWIDLRSSE